MEREEVDQKEQLLRVAEVATALNISRALAYRLLRSGEIPVVRISRAVRVKPSDLRAYVQRSRRADLEV